MMARHRTADFGIRVLHNVRASTCSWRPLVRLQAAVFLVMCGYGAVYGTLSPYVASLGAGPVVAGILIGVTGITRLALNIPSGALSQRYGRVGVMTAGLGFIILGSAFVLLIHGLAGLWTGLVLQAIGSAAYATAALGMVIDIGSPPSRVRDMAGYQGAYLIGISLGPILGGAAATEAGFGAPFALQMLLCALALTVVVTGERNPRPDLPRMTLSCQFGPRVYAAAIGAYGVMFVRTSALWLILPFVAGKLHSMNVGMVGALITIGALANVIVLPMVSGLTQRWGPISVATIGSGIVLAAVGVLLIPDATAIWISSFLIGIGGGLSMPTFTAIAANATPPERAGATMGLMRSATDLAMMSGPLIIGVFIEQNHLQIGLFTAILIVMVCLCFAWFGAKRRLDDRRSGS